MILRRLLVVGCLLALAACVQTQSTVPPTLAKVRGDAACCKTLAGKYIKHVIVIIQENRSLESFFAGYPGANAPLVGYGIDDNGKPYAIPLKQVNYDQSVNLEHSWSAGIRMWNNGAMDGFSRFGKPGAHEAYQYVDEKEVDPYWMMAQQYVLADEMFPTEMGPSYTAHLTLIAGTDNIDPDEAQADFPSGSGACDSQPGTKSTFVDEYRIIHWRIGPYPCFKQFRTMADTLDAAGVSWNYYETRILHAGIWAPFESISNVRFGPDYFKDIRAPSFAVLDDIKAGKLADVAWVTPTKADSDHPGPGTPRGPSWVGTIVNAIGHSKYWNDTAIVVVWDDWGGQYDNMPPPQLDFRGLGIRVPCLIVSPYAKQNYVSHTLYEWGSILKFIEQVYGLPSLGSTQDGYTDTRANSLIDSFDFNQSPRPFKTIPTKYKIHDFLNEPAWMIEQPVDEE
jgi:phospholipase C